MFSAAVGPRDAVPRHHPMKVAFTLSLVALALAVLLYWDIQRHRELEACVLRGGHAWLDDRCCQLLSGAAAMGALRCVKE